MDQVIVSKKEKKKKEKKKNSSPSKLKKYDYHTIIHFKLSFSAICVGNVYLSCPHFL